MSCARPLLVLGAAVALLMLLVCANLSNLLLARATTRRKQMAVQIALGAGRLRLIRQLLIESLVVALLGAGLGITLAISGTALLAAIEGTEIPLLSDVRFDRGALLFATLLSVATGLAFGIAPALVASSTAPADALEEGGRGSSGGRRPALPEKLAGRLRDRFSRASC